MIQAADSIAEMNRTSETVVAKIVNIKKTFHDLQQKYLIGFKMEPPENSSQKYEINLNDCTTIEFQFIGIDKNLKSFIFSGQVVVFLILWLYKLKF